MTASCEDSGGGAPGILGVIMRHFDGVACRCALDEGWTVLDMAGRFEALSGYTPEAFARQHGDRLAAISHADDRAVVDEVVRAAAAFGGGYGIEYRIRCQDGAEKWVAERGTVVQGAGGELVREAVIQDRSEQVLGQIRLAEVELRYQSIFENSVVGMFRTSANGHYLAANGALAALYGYPSPQALMASLSDIANHLYVDPSRREQFKALIREQGRVTDFESEVYRAGGTRIWISENAHAVYGPDGELLCYEGTVEDVTGRHQYQVQLEYQATHDSLTALPNRTLLPERLQQAIAEARRRGGKVVVAFIDLDNFKFVNDSLGHAAGDQLLVGVARRLQRCVRGVDTVARYGGDEFVLIFNDGDDLAGAIRVLKRIPMALRAPFMVDGQELRVGCSLGVALYPEDGEDMPTLLRHADVAMYHAKQQGRGQFQFYRPELNVAARERLELESALRRGLEVGELSVAYQPKVLADGTPCGVEALVRWHHAGQAISPDRFIPVAEKTGLIEPITRFVLRTACRDAAAWRAEGLPPMRVAVNLSALQLGDQAVVELVAAELARSGFPGEWLELEITESALIGDMARTVEILKDLKALGLRIAVDDFGTGYSSLAYLSSFPIDVLKIDRAFVQECDQGRAAFAIPGAIIALAQNLGLRVVAEGVEHPAQLAVLHARGCDEFQGFLFARPMRAAAVADFIRARSPGGEPECLASGETAA